MRGRNVEYLVKKMQERITSIENWGTTGGLNSFSVKAKSYVLEENNLGQQLN